jgi:hypothetical protein
MKIARLLDFKIVRFLAFVLYFLSFFLVVMPIGIVLNLIGEIFGERAKTKVEDWICRGSE